MNYIKEYSGMITSFSVENYKNFKDKVVLNFADTHDYKYNNQCIKNKRKQPRLPLCLSLFYLI